MSQWMKVLRGCLAAYLSAVVLVGGGGSLLEGNLAMMVLVGVYGAILLVPLTALTLAIWAMFARSGARVHAVKAIAICMGVFAVLGLGYGGVGLFSVLQGAVAGTIFGAVFWLGAFGVSREVQFGDARV